MFSNYYGRNEGVFGEVYRSTVDIGAGQFFIISERLRLVSMTHFYDIDGYCFLVKRPPPRSNYLAIIMPFDMNVWIIGFVTMLCISSFYFIWLHFKPDKTFSPWRAILYDFGALVHQSWPTLPKDTLLKFFVMWNLIGPFILTTIYQGKILSFLTISIAKEPVNTLSGLVDYPGMIGSYNKWLESKFSNVDGPVYNELEKRLVTAFYDQDEMGKTSNGDYTLVDSRSSLEYGIRRRFVDK